MNKATGLQGGSLVALMAFSILACGLIPAMPSISTPDFFAEPTDNGTAGPKSPLAGHWAATADFGNFDFYISNDGTQLRYVNIALSNWMCGGSIITMSLKAGSWSVSDGRFSARIDLNPPHIEELTLDGAYDEKSKTFSGAWDQDMYGTHCTGTWKSEPQN
jgi:hypothetical protein